MKARVYRKIGNVCTPATMPNPKKTGGIALDEPTCEELQEMNTKDNILISLLVEAIDSYCAPEIAQLIVHTAFSEYARLP